MKPKIVFLEDGYRIEVGSAKSDDTDFGDPCELATGGKTYVAHVDLGKKDEPESSLPDGVWMYEVVDCEIVPLPDEVN